MRTGALERAVGRGSSRREVQRCGLCETVVVPGHRHVLDTRDSRALCACTACLLLFQREAAGGGHYRLIPDRRVRLPRASTDALNVPVGLAFFVAHGDGSVVAHYPSPLGTTESEVDIRAWSDLARGSPEVATLQPEVEALLVRADHRGGPDELWLLPVDDCYRLVAVIRRHWRGMSGGSAVWGEIARFFDDIGART
jgi:hypothetical protein